MAEAVVNEPDSLVLSEFDLWLRAGVKKSQQFVQSQLDSLKESDLKNRVTAFSEDLHKCTASRAGSKLIISELLKKFKNELESASTNDGSHNIKQEKQSIGSNNDEEEKENILKNVKREPDNEMPPPSVTGAVKKKTKKALKPEPSVRNTRSRTRKMKKHDNEEQTTPDGDDTDGRDSDVIVKPINVSVIEITDDENTPETPARKPVVRSSRARTVKNKKNLVQENTKRSCSLEEKSDTGEQNGNKNVMKTKYQKTKQDVEPQTVKETADENAETQEKQATKSEVMDKTMTLMSDNMKSNEPFNMQDIMTSDESECEKNPDKNNKTKAIFNPYVRSPLKKKIEAFEKLGAHQQSPQTRARAQKKDDLGTSKIPSAKHFGSSTLNRFLPASHSTTKKNRLLPASNTSVLQSKVPSTTTKISQAEYRERELHFREREAEALHKKEAILLAVAEEKKRIREEKQQKAQQSRELKEKDKQKQLEEAERAKELRLKQIRAEREERLAKQRAEAERKRMLAKAKALEEKRKEEQRKAHDAALNEMKKVAPAQPIYMTQNTPLLPTTDCYDSDEDGANHNNCLPDWFKENNMLRMEKTQLAAGHEVRNTFFFVTPKTLDLKDVFPSIEPRKLTRSSSAMWTKPPRYTLCMSPCNEGSNESE